MAGIFFVQKEIYEIKVDDYESLFQFRGYNDATDEYVFYDLAFLGQSEDKLFRYFPSEVLQDVSDTIKKQNNLYKFYE